MLKPQPSGGLVGSAQFARPVSALLAPEKDVPDQARSLELRPGRSSSGASGASGSDLFEEGLRCEDSVGTCAIGHERHGPAGRCDLQGR